MSDSEVKDLLRDASLKLREEADKLRTTIDHEEQALAEKLAPLKAKLAELDEAIARIEGKPSTTNKTTSNRAPRGHNRKLILDYVEANPGATGSEVSCGTGISNATAYSTLAKLVQDGELTKAKNANGVGYARARP